MDNLDVLQGYLKHKNKYFIPGKLKVVRKKKGKKHGQSNESCETFSKLLQKCEKASLIENTRVSITPDNLNYFLRYHTPKTTPKERKFKFAIGIQTNNRISRSTHRSIPKFLETIQSSNDSLYFPRIFVREKVFQ